MISNNPLVSIIVPIYKVENYLHRCVDSILQQTYSNLEIILVDDGSPDQCPQICDKYASIDSRIKVIHKKNGGLSDARNYALDIMKGDYVTFVDSDDYIANNMIELFMQSILTHQCAMVVCGVNIIDAKQNIYDKRNIDKSQLFTGAEITKQIIKDNFPHNFAWGKLYKSTLFNDIRFPKGRYYEDIATIYKLTAKCKNIFCLSNNLYFYFLGREGNITSELSTSKAIKSYLDVIQSECERLSFCESNALYNDSINTIKKHLQTLALLGIQANIKLGYKNCQEFKEKIENILRSKNALPQKGSLHFALRHTTLYYILYPLYHKLVKLKR